MTNLDMEALFNPVLPHSLSAYVVAVATAVSIYIIYRVFENKWPDAYFATTDKSSAILAMSPVWFFGFRFIPIFAVTTLAFSFLKIDDYSIQERIASGLIVSIIYIIPTDFLALYKIFKKSSSIYQYSNKASQVLTHVLSALFVFSLIMAGSYASSLLIFQKVVPTAQGVADNLWSSLLIAVFLSIFYRLPIWVNHWSDIDVYKISRRRIDPEIFREIKRQSTSYNANQYLIESIAIVENLQRPKWLRRFEWLKSWFIKEGTYGIMQVYGNSYISDIDSVKLATDKFFKDSKDMGLDSLLELVRKYNPDEKYLDMIQEVYKATAPPEYHNN